MPSRHDAAALTATLTNAEHSADTRGWDALPELLGLFHTPALTGAPGLDIEALPIDESVWQPFDQIVPNLRLPYWVGLRAITEHLTSPPPPAWLPAWIRAGRRRLVGFAFLCEGLDTHAADPAATRADRQPDVDGVQVRVLTACDIDGRYYQILRVRGASHPTVTVLADPPATVRATVIPDCLYRLVNAFGS
jgi:hypothetical protein